MKKLWVWFLTKASIRKKLIISFAVLVSVPVLVLGIFSFVQARASIETETEATMQSNLSRLESELNTRLQHEVDYIKYMAYNVNFRSALEAAPRNPIGLAMELNENIEPAYWYFLTSDSNMKGISVYTPNVENSIGPFVKPDTNVQLEPWYQSHADTFDMVWSFEDGRIFASRSLLDAGTSSIVIGVLRAEYFTRLVSDPIDSMEYLGNGVILVDEQGQTVYQKMEESVMADEAMYAYLAGDSNTNTLDKQVLWVESEVRIPGWKLYYYTDRAVVSQQLAPILGSTLLAVAGCLLLVILLISLLSRVLSGRILALQSTAALIADGQFDAAQSTNDGDEIGALTNSVAKMARRLEEMIARVYQMEIDKKNAELAALQAKINPHFLYNCLSSIKWKAIYRGADDIADTTGRIATFYRTSLNEGRQFTTVKNELENIRSYIEIQRSMHDDGFEAVFELEEAGQDECMLNFLLQPIVENAIEHGLDMLEDVMQGRLVIRYQKRGESLVFQILNSGPVADVGYIEQTLGQPKTGYGLFNIRQRIQLYYGENSGIQASITEEGLTCFTVTIATIPGTE